MNQPFRSSCFATALLLLSPLAARAQSSPVKEGYNAFRLLRTRNIFDPERRATVSDVAPAVRTPPAAPRANFIALTGTMVSREKSLAFFTGSRPEYSKVITVGESVGDFKITAITATQVELTLAGKPITVVIGRQLPLAGSFVASGPPPVLPAPAAAVTPLTAGATPPGTSAPASDKNETLRRMMEARQREMSK